MRPPLGRELFDSRFAYALTRTYRMAQHQADLLRRLPETRSLEAELESLVDRSERERPIRRDLIALRFYLRRIIWSCSDYWEDLRTGGTNYHVLLRALFEWQDAHPGEALSLVTFNYDLLLDHAVRDVIGGVDLRTVDGYVASERVKIFKPHGSVNWTRVAPVPVNDMDQDSAERAVIDLGLQDSLPTMGAEVVIPDLSQYAHASEALYPSLSVPMQRKPFEFPDAHRDRMISALHETTRLLIIGWKMAETHFLDLLREHLKSPATQIVSSRGVRAQALGADLRRSYPVGQLMGPHYDGFTQYVQSCGWRDLLDP